MMLDGIVLPVMCHF